MVNWEELISGYESKNDGIKSKTAGICSYYWVKNKDKSTTYILMHFDIYVLKEEPLFTDEISVTKL